VDTTDPEPVDGESWDPKSGVGATATVVAAARAMATQDPRGLINDPNTAEISRTFRAHGMDIDIPSLMQTGDRSDVVDYLRRKGWKAISAARTDLFIRSDLPLPPAGDENALGEVYYISGTLPDRGGSVPAGRPVPEIGDSGPSVAQSKRGWARRFARLRPTAGHQ